MTTEIAPTARQRRSARNAIVLRAWLETRARFFSALALLAALVLYAILTSKGYMRRYDAHHPDEPLRYSVYVWSGLFAYALQGLWILAAFILGLGGLARERAAGVVLFTLGLPVGRTRLFLVRAAVAAVEALMLALVSALLIALCSAVIGEAYPPLMALMFGLLMAMGGMLFVSLGLLLSELFEAEFTAPVIGLCTIVTIFLSYKAHKVHRWNIFDGMSGALSIDPDTQLLHGSGVSTTLVGSLVVALVLLAATTTMVRRRDF